MLIGKIVVLVVTVHGIKFRELGNYAHPRKWASSERNLLLQAQQGPSERADRYSYGRTGTPFEFTDAIPEVTARSQFVDDIHTTGPSVEVDDYKENEGGGSGSFSTRQVTPYVDIRAGSPYYASSKQWFSSRNTPQVYGNTPYPSPGNGNWPNPGSGPYIGMEYRPPHVVGQQWIPRGNTPVMRHLQYRNPGNGNWPIPGSGQHSDIEPEWIPMMRHPHYRNPENGNWPKKNTKPWEIQSTPSPRLSHQPRTEYDETKSKTDDHEDRMLTDTIAYQNVLRKSANGGLPRHNAQSLEFLVPYPRNGAEPTSAGEMSVRKYRTPRKNHVVHQGYRNTPFTNSGKTSHLSKTGYWSQAPMNPLNQFDSRITTPSPFRWSVVPDVPMKNIQTWNGPPPMLGTPSSGKRMPFQSVQTYSVFTSPSGNAHSVHYRSHIESEGNDFQRLSLPFDKGFDLPDLEIDHFKTNPLFANGDHMDRDPEEPTFGSLELGDAPFMGGSWSTFQRRLMPLTSTAHDLSSLEMMASI